MAASDDLPVEIHWPGTTRDPRSHAFGERAPESPNDEDPEDSADVGESDPVDRRGVDHADTLFREASGRANRSDRSDAASTDSGEPRLRLRLRLRSPEGEGPTSEVHRAELLATLERQAADLSRRIEALRR